MGWIVSLTSPVLLAVPWPSAHSKGVRVVLAVHFVHCLLTHSALRCSLRSFSAASCLSLSSSASCCCLN